jgi:hypothetical protein
MEKTHVAIVAQVPQTLHSSSISVVMKGILFLSRGSFFCGYLAFHCTDVTQTSHRPVTADSLETVQVLSKSVSKERYFTLKPK